MNETHTHVDADGQTVRVDLLRSPEVDVPASGGRSGVEAWVVRGEFTAEGCSSQVVFRHRTKRIEDKG